MKAAGVTRIEGPQGRGSGWMVRLTRQGRTRHKWFADGQHGGKLKAFQAARGYHAKLQATAPPPTPLAGRKTARNTSGKVGVRLEKKVQSRNRRTYRYQSYVAFWTGADGAETITFSCDKYGKRKAFQLASIARDHHSTDRRWIERRLGAARH
jgi:hypothetical protein